MDTSSPDNLDSEYSQFSSSEDATTLALNDFFDRQVDPNILSGSSIDPTVNVAQWIRNGHRQVTREDSQNRIAFQLLDTVLESAPSNDVVEETPEAVNQNKLLPSDTNENKSLDGESFAVIEHTESATTHVPEDPYCFFDQLENADKEINELSRSWRKVRSIHYKDERVFTESQSIEDRWFEILAVFQPDCSIGSTVTFESSFQADWNIFNKNAMQYVVWTKVCNNHPENELVEMTKEQSICESCRGSNISASARLTIPFCLDDVPLPLNERPTVFVSFLATQLPGGSESLLFTNEKLERMFQIHNRMRRTSTILQISLRDYENWYESVKEFTKNSLKDRHITVTNGRLIRRKLHEFENMSKRQCFIFADTFDIS